MPFFFKDTLKKKVHTYRTIQDGDKPKNTE